jgi:hypothetical protein
MLPSAGDFTTGYALNEMSRSSRSAAPCGAVEHEIQTFLIHPAAVTVPGPLSHPIELYAHFSAYHEERREP